MNNDYENINQDNKTTNEYYYPNEPIAANSDTVEEPTKKKKIKNSIPLKVIAFCMSFTLLGGIAGGTSAFYFSQKNTPIASISTLANDASSEKSLDTVASLNSSSTLSVNSIYETYKSAIVGVANEGTTTNAYGQVSPSASSGTGFIISPDGYIITNNHVIEGADKVTIALYDSKSYTATIVGADAENDVALLKIDATDLNTVKLGNSDNLKVGESVVAIGNPLGELTYTVTAGIVSAENREINTSATPINMFQTDLAINPGNSGGPVLNLKGEVVGIASAKYSASSIEGLGFAIPINDAVNIANQLKTNGYVTGRSSLGISVMDINDAIAADTGIVSGAYVAAVDTNGGSAKAGVQEGDIITALGNTTIKSVSELSLAKKNFKAGDTSTMTIYRNGEEMILPIIFDEAIPKTDLLG